MEAWTRRQLLRAGLAAGAAMLAPLARAARRLVEVLTEVHVRNGAAPYSGDSSRLTTISATPGSGRNRAIVRFRLDRAATVRLDVLATGQGARSEQLAGATRTDVVGLEGAEGTFPAGTRQLVWRPPVGLAPRTYVLRVNATPSVGLSPGTTARVVVRVLGVDAGFLVRSAQPGDVADLVVRTNARSLAVLVLHCGLETEPTYANDELKGVPVTPAAEVDWTRHRDGPGVFHLPVGQDWASGVYAVRLDADDGRVGFAPLVVRPPEPRERVAVVLPTSTWQAYNFYDRDGDGWGDTWYARWQTMVVDLGRPYANCGVPYRFRSYELGFLHWLAQEDVRADFYADEDLERFTSAQLRGSYDLVVFPGHTEYVTPRLYDLVQGYRDRGGNLMFLSANNFFRQVTRDGRSLRLVEEWRKLGRPEAALCGVQYIASDRGERQEPFTVVGADLAPWAFDDTGLTNGSQFGRYGIEIDARAPSSPQETIVLATISDLFGPGKTAEMTYYEHSSGARVFSAGTLNFGGQVMIWPEATQLFRNVWARLAPS